MTQVSKAQPEPFKTLFGAFEGVSGMFLNRSITISC
jgi:hypothetical protein